MSEWGATASGEASRAGQGSRVPGDDPATVARMSIGEVLSQLRAEFPDTTISKLRFLESEGLVEPARTASGYRKYSAADVARLRFVLTAQRDRYLPLRVIREELEAVDVAAPEAGAGSQPAGSRAAGSRPAASRAGESADGMARPRLVAVGPDGRVPGIEPDEAPAAETRLTREKLVERSGIAPESLAELESLGMVTPRAAGWYDADALVVAAAIAGLGAYGLEVRHLRGYKAAADRDVGLFAQLVAPIARQNDPAARARAAEAAQELTGLAQQLRAALVRAGLRDVLGR